MPAPQSNRWVRWLLPDAAVLVSSVTFLYCLFLYDGATQLFRDSDTGWHIVNGESILRGATLPVSDPYSFSEGGKPWFAWEWGADVVMGAVHRWDGLRGVALLFAGLIAGCTWIWFQLNWTLKGNFFLACLLASPMLSTVNLHWLARPHVFSWVLSLLTIRLLERPVTRWWIFPVAGALWANLHASFFFLPLACFAYCAAHLVRPLIWDLHRTSEWRRARRLLLAGGLAMAGTFVNPYGWQLHRHVIGYLGNRELLMRIGEFQSFNFHVEGAWQVLLTVLVAMAGGICSLANRGLAHFFLATGLVAISLRSARGLPLVALLALPIAAGSITATLDGLAVTSRLRRRLDQFLEYSNRLRLLDRRAGGLVWIPVLLGFSWVVLHAPARAARIGFPADQFPVAAALEVAKLPEQARLFAPDKFGGYLIYRFGGQRKVFFDGRSDFYGVDFMKRYIKLVELRPGWQAIWNGYRFSHALLPVDYPLAAALPELGWKQLYADGTAVLLEAPRGAVSAPANVISSGQPGVPQRGPSEPRP